VHTVVEQLVWAHKHGPAEARTVATEFFLTHSSVIRVWCGGLACFIDGCEWREFLALKYNTLKFDDALHLVVRS
jgi:hypothetical protein